MSMLVRTRSAVVVTRTVMLAILAVGLLLTAEPAASQTRLAPVSQAATDLGAPDAGGVTRVDQLLSVGQANAYTFSVPAGPSAIHVYVGDLWYDVDVSLWRLANRLDDPLARAGA